MDPYLETPERWRNMHNNLATEIQAQLAPLLRPRYYADQEPRFVYDTGLGVATKHQVLPDVSVMESPNATPHLQSEKNMQPASTASSQPLEQCPDCAELLGLQTFHICPVSCCYIFVGGDSVDAICPFCDNSFETGVGHVCLELIKLSEPAQ